MNYKYKVWNNTNYQVPFLTNNRREAERVWRNKVKPGPDAGNLYAAGFDVRCGKCGNWKSATAEYDTCGCK